MIELKISDYCENCPYFEAVTTKGCVRNGNGDMIFDTIITCESSDKCLRLVDYFDEEE